MPFQIVFRFKGDLLILEVAAPQTTVAETGTDSLFQSGLVGMITQGSWMILTALKTNQESISVNPFYIFPAHGWHWENFGTVWQSYNFIILYKNTILMIFFRVVCACLTATMAGYAFGRLKFPFKGPLFALVLIQMMVPGQIFIIL